MRIDAHHHLWQLSNPWTDWPTQELSAIYRDFGEDDFAQVAGPAAIDGAVLIQAAPSFAETQHLMGLADESEMIVGVVGWVDFESPMAATQISEFAENPKAVGIRPMLQSIAEPAWILRPEFDPIFAALGAADLTFDALVRADQIRAIAQLAKRYPELRIVLDHAGKPNIAGGSTSIWHRDLGELAANDNVCCKFSGLWTETDGRTSDEVIGPYARIILNTFGGRRIMWGSDWPVLNLAGEYSEWLAQAEHFVRKFGGSEWNGIFGEVACEFYRLPVSGHGGE